MDACCRSTLPTPAPAPKLHRVPERNCCDLTICSNCSAAPHHDHCPIADDESFCSDDLLRDKLDGDLALTLQDHRRRTNGNGGADLIADMSSMSPSSTSRCPARPGSRWQGIETATCVVFVTAYDQYAVDVSGA